MDIRPRKRPSADSTRPTSPALIQPQAEPSVPATSLVVPSPASAPLPIKAELSSGKNTIRPRKKGALLSLLAVLLLGVLLVAGGWMLYQFQLAAVNDRQGELVRVKIERGSTPAQISALLKDQGVIRSQEAFMLYTRLTKTQNLLQAGVYRLSPAETTPEIVTRLTEGLVDTFDLRFLPGATLAENREVLVKAGYSEDEVDTALLATYETPLFDSRPTASDLEGYIYGETYKFSSDVTVGEILARVFAHYEEIVKENDLVAKFRAQGLSLYEGITLASIIQREAVKGDEPQIAQVFYTRLAQGMKLGSDVTYQYIADKTGVPRDTNLDSPYNTRRYPGLPQGPISVPGISSLLAVAHPASGDYRYFLSGDDDVTYYARTLSGHEANIVAHCTQKCSIL
jgi:UPF0755 protein